MAGKERQEQLISRMYSVKPGDIDTAVQLAGDMMAAKYWTRETGEMLSQIVARNEVELSEFNERIRTL